MQQQVNRSATAFLLSLMSAVALMLTSLGSAHAADVVANPGSVHAEFTGGVIALAGYKAVDLPTSATALTFDGEISANGDFKIPAAAVKSETVNVNSYNLKLAAKADWTGQIDPGAGAAGLRMPLAIEVVDLSGCEMGTIDVNRALTTTSGGVAYNPSDGTFKVAAVDVPVPAATTCGAVNGAIDTLTGGKVTVAFGFKLTPAVTSGGGTIEGGIAASDSTSLGGSSSSGGSGSGGVVSNTITNIYGSSSNSIRLKLTAEAASRRYRRGYVSVYASCTEDCELSATGTFSGSKRLRRSKISTANTVLSLQDEEQTLRLKVSKKLRKKIASAKAAGDRPKLKIRVRADNSDVEDSIAKTLTVRL